VPPGTLTAVAGFGTFTLPGATALTRSPRLHGYSTAANSGEVCELAGWHADAAGEAGQPGEGVAAVGSQEVFGYLVTGGTVADFGWGGALGGQQRADAGLGFAPLVVGAATSTQ
jgi:hypothetical protein